MSELERQLTEALKRLSAQYETEQRRHSGQVEALRQRVEALQGRVERQSEENGGLRQHVERQSGENAALQRRIEWLGRASCTLSRVVRHARRDLVMMIAALSQRGRGPDRDYVPSR